MDSRKPRVKIIEVLPPPDNPVYAGDPSRWEAIEKRLGTPLPIDYKNFINTYGTGFIGGTVWIYNPFFDYHAQNLLSANENWLALFREVKAEFPKRYPFPIYPESGGVLLCGRTDTGDKICWKTTGDPDSWTIILVDKSGIDVEEYDGGITSFLIAFLTGEFQGELLLGEPCPSNEMLFRPWWYDMESKGSEK